MRIFIALFLLLMLFGCGGGGTSSGGTSAGNTGASSNGSPSQNNPAPSSQTANLALRFTLLTRAVPAYVSQLRISGLNSMGDVLFGPQNFAKSSQILVTGLPTSCTQIRIEYRNGTAVRGIGVVPVTLLAGQTFELNDPDFQDVEAVLNTLVIEAPSVSVPAGSSLQLAALGRFNDSSQQDLTDSVSWSSSAPSVAEINNRGLITTRGSGTAEIYAQLGEIRAQFHLTVTIAQLVSIRIEPGSLRLPKGTTGQLQAVGLYTNQHEHIISANWSSNNGSATVNSAGLVTASNLGTSTVQASLDNVSNSIEVTVTAAELVSVQLPGDQVLGPNAMIELPLTASYTDQSTRVLTNTRFESTNDFVASVLNNGMLTGKNPGTAVITATDLDSGMTDQLNVQVTGSPLLSLSITPNKPWLRKNQNQALTVTGLYQDGTTRNLTASVNYAANNDHVTVSNTAATRGLVTGQSGGLSQVTATYPGSGISATVPVQVVNFVKTATLTASGTVSDMISSRDGSSLYLLSGGLQVLNPVTQTFEVKVNGSGTWMDLSPDGNTVLIAANGNTLRAVDTRTWSTRLITVGVATRAIAFVNDHRAIALTANSLITLDTDQGTVLNTYTNRTYLDDWVRELRIDPSVQKAYVADHGLSPSSISRFSISTGTPVFEETVRSGSNGRALRINPGKGLVFACGGGNSAPSGTPYGLTYYGLNSFLDYLGVFRIGTYPLDAAFSPDGATLFGLNGANQDVTIARTDTAATIYTLPLNLGGSGRDPLEIEASTDGKYVYVYSNTSNAQTPQITILTQQ